MDDPFDQRVAQDFSRARNKSFLHKVREKLRGRSTALLPFDAVREKLRVGGPIYRGVRAVPLAQIVGSVGRYQDFDTAFLPVHDHMRERWKSIGRAFYQEVNLPPVTLYKLGDVYFVLDGNHRVSVAREQGATYIDAEVMEVAVRVPIGPDLRLEDLEILGERVNFLERTGLDRLRPDVAIDFTIAGGYERLLEHIAVHRHYLGIERQREIPEDEAVGHWADHVYTPLVDVVREHGILAEFPGRTASDLYLWIMDHQHYLREAVGGDDGVTTASAADDYAEHYSEHPVTRVRKAARQVVQGLLAPLSGRGAEEPEGAPGAPPGEAKSEETGE